MEQVLYSAQFDESDKDALFVELQGLNLAWAKDAAGFWTATVEEPSPWLQQLIEKAHQKPVGLGDPDPIEQMFPVLLKDIEVPKERQRKTLPQLLRDMGRIYDDRQESEAQITANTYKRLVSSGIQEQIASQRAVTKAATSFPQFVVANAQARVGSGPFLAVSLVSLAESVRMLRGRSLSVDIFARFLEETYSPEELSFFLLCRRYVRDAQRGRDGLLSTFDAMRCLKQSLIEPGLLRAASQIVSAHMGVTSEAAIAAWQHHCTLKRGQILSTAETEALYAPVIPAEVVLEAAVRIYHRVLQQSASSLNDAPPPQTASEAGGDLTASLMRRLEHELLNVLVSRRLGVRGVGERAELHSTVIEKRVAQAAAQQFIIGPSLTRRSEGTPTEVAELFCAREESLYKSQRPSQPQKQEDDASPVDERQRRGHIIECIMRKAVQLMDNELTRAGVARLPAPEQTRAREQAVARRQQIVFTTLSNLLKEEGPRNMLSQTVKERDQGRYEQLVERFVTHVFIRTDMRQQLQRAAVQLCRVQRR